MRLSMQLEQILQIQGYIYVDKERSVKGTFDTRFIVTLDLAYQGQSWKWLYNPPV